MSRIDDSQWAHIVSGENLKNVPLLGFTSGDGRIRNPLYALQLTPGSLMTSQQYFRVNGAPGNTESIRIEGQDANNGIVPSRTMATQAGVDAVEEFSIQTSNYAAEYGQAGSGIVNIAMKSGTNAYHGSLYSYWAHEALNEHYPFTGRSPKTGGTTMAPPWAVPFRFPRFIKAATRHSSSLTLSNSASRTFMTRLSPYRLSPSVRAIFERH